MAQAGLHVIFDSNYHGRHSSVAELEYVSLRSHGFSMLTDPSTSVVAVHGLNFKNNPNHAQETWTMSDKL